MAEAVNGLFLRDREVAGQVQAVCGVYAGGFQEFLAQGTAEVGNLTVQGPTSVVDDAANQGVTVGVQARGGHADDDIASAYPFRTQQQISLDDTRASTCDVVLVRSQQAGMLSSLATHQRGSGNLAGPGDAADNIGHALRDNLAGGDVVGHEERLGANYDDVIDNHADEVVTNGVVDVHGLRDGDLGTHSVGGGGQQRLLEGQQLGHVIQAGESAETTNHGRAVGGLDGFLHQLNGEVARFGVDTCAGVSNSLGS